MKHKINDDKRYNVRRSIAITHRKGREERKADVQKSLRSLRSLRLIDFHGIPMAQGNKAMVVFKTGFTGSTGCVLSFNPVMWSRMEKTRIHSPLAELTACYVQGCAGSSIKEPQINADERRYDYNDIVNIFHMGQSTTNHQDLSKFRDFLLFTGTIQKTAESAEARRENNTSLRHFASSVVNLFCHDLFIRNKLKSHSIPGVCT